MVCHFQSCPYMQHSMCGEWSRISPIEVGSRAFGPTKPKTNECHVFTLAILAGPRVTGECLSWCKDEVEIECTSEWQCVMHVLQMGGHAPTHSGGSLSILRYAELWSYVHYYLYGTGYITPVGPCACIKFVARNPNSLWRRKRLGDMCPSLLIVKRATFLCHNTLVVLRKEGGSL